MDRGGSTGLPYLASALLALALIVILVVVGNVVAQPIGTVVAFAIGAFMISSRAELSRDPGGLDERWLIFLGVLIAGAVPVLLIVA